MTVSERRALADRVRYLTNHGRHLEAWQVYHLALGAAPDRLPPFNPHRPIVSPAS
jgi:hypothetical protein